MGRLITTPVGKTSWLPALSLMLPWESVWGALFSPMSKAGVMFRLPHQPLRLGLVRDHRFFCLFWFWCVAWVEQYFLKAFCFARLPFCWPLPRESRIFAVCCNIFCLCLLDFLDCWLLLSGIYAAKNEQNKQTKT